MARRRYGLSVLNYVATSNHIHLLVADQGNNEISAAMQLTAGRTAQEFNLRKNRRGAFWEDRYHATAVQTDQHLVQCMTYIDLNMVRAGAVSNPGEWDVTGYSEIQRPWKRKSVIDLSTLCQLLDVPSYEQLAQCRRDSVSDALDCTERQPAWTEAAGVGDRAFLCKLQSALGPKGLHRQISNNSQVLMLKDATGGYCAERAPKSGD